MLECAYDLFCTLDALAKNHNAMKAKILNILQLKEKEQIMIIDRLCFVCVPFVNERGTHCKDPNGDVNYPLVNMMACDGVERAGFVPMSPLHLWGSCFKYNYNKERIIDAGAKLIELCDCFYFCDCEYDEKAHDEMEFWRIKAQILNKRFISIDRKFIDL